MDRGELQANALMTGRPSDYAPELANQICDRLAGGASLRAICSANDMPGKTTVFRWLNEHEEFRDQYARAREAQAEHWADEIIEIADDSGVDVIPEEDGRYRIDGEAIQRARLRVEARKWLMSKLAPKKYGDRVTAEHTGEVTHRVARIECVIVHRPLPVIERDDRKLIEASGTPEA